MKCNGLSLCLQNEWNQIKAEQENIKLISVDVI